MAFGLTFRAGYDALALGSAFRMVPLAFRPSAARLHQSHDCVPARSLPAVSTRRLRRLCGLAVFSVLFFVFFFNTT